MTLNNLGLVFHEQHRYAEAKSYYEQALVVWEQIRGAEHPGVATALHNLAEIYLEEGQLEQAEKHYLHSLAIRERSLQPGHPAGSGTECDELGLLVDSKVSGCRV